MLVSLCTTSMNRLHHIKETLVHNLNVSRHFESVEFVLLDYNSTDSLESWIRDNLMSEIESGKLVYLKESEAKFFDASRSRNLSYLGSSGNIVCNVDADNFIHRDFAEYLYHEFKNRDFPCLVHAIHSRDKNAWGRLAMKKRDFIAIGGYNETMNGYGGEDWDLFRRAKANAWQMVEMPAIFVNKIIHHSHYERMKNFDPNHFKKVQWLRESDQLKVTNRKNIKLAALQRKDIIQRHAWGNATLIRNFTETITVSGDMKLMI